MVIGNLRKKSDLSFLFWSNGSLKKNKCADLSIEIKKNHQSYWLRASTQGHIFVKRYRYFIFYTFIFIPPRMNKWADILLLFLMSWVLLMVIWGFLKSPKDQQENCAKLGSDKNIFWKIATLANVLAFIYAKISYVAIIKVTITTLFQLIQNTHTDTLLQNCQAHNRKLFCLFTDRNKPKQGRPIRKAQLKTLIILFFMKNIDGIRPS